MLADTLKNLLNAPDAGCAVHRWVEEQGPEVSELFNQLKVKPGVNLAELFRVLSAEANGKLPFGKTLFNYHMRNDCSCPQA